MGKFKYAMMFFALALVGLFGYAVSVEAGLQHMADACKVLGVVSASICGITFLVSLYDI
jgi:hypothetical protein